MSLVKVEILESQMNTSNLSCKRTYSGESSGQQLMKRSRVDTSQDDLSNQQLNCEICSGVFANSSNLRQHMEAFHFKTTMWTCSECNKVFTSKSNLKVHLRVHTRIKPYHCKHCNYSCMHHSSIKEHLAKIHPGIIHSSTKPAYAFNSVAVPDPDMFNSSDFNREEFIAQAKYENEKLLAQLNGTKQNNASGSPVSISPVSSNISSSSSSPNVNETFSESINESTCDRTDSPSLPTKKRRIRTSTARTTRQIQSQKTSLNSSPSIASSNSSGKFTSFSIDSLIGTDSNDNTNKQPQENYNNQLFTPSNWTNYAAQLYYFNYLNQLRQKQMFSNSFYHDSI